MELTYETDRADYVAFVRMAQRRWGKPLAFVYTVLPSLGVLAILGNAVADWRSLGYSLSESVQRAIPTWPLAVMMVAFVAAFGSYYALRPKLVATRMQRDDSGGAARLVMQEQGLAVTSSGIDVHIGWDRVQEIADAEGIVTFVIARMSAVINGVFVPAKAFADADERERFIREARRLHADARPAD